MGHKRAWWLNNASRLGGPQCFEAGTKPAMARSWVVWLHNPCRLVDSQRLRAWKKISSGRQEGQVTT